MRALACRRWPLGLLLTVILGACSGHRGAPAKVRRLATSDLRCAGSEVTYVRKKHDVYRAYGCGKVASYVRTCKGTCQWRLDSPPQPSDGPPP